MKTGKKCLFVTFCAALILFLASIPAAYKIISADDFSRLKPQIIQAVKGATGRELYMGGQIRLDFSLSPTLFVEDVALRNVAWGSKPDLARIKNLRIQIGLVPLLFGNIHIKRLIITEPDILLETDAEGRWNTHFKGPEPATDNTAKKPAVENGRLLLFNRMEIKGGRLTYRHGPSGQIYSLKLSRLKAHMKDEYSPLFLAMDGKYRNQPVAVQAIFDQLASIIDVQKPSKLVLNARISNATLSVKGEIADSFRVKGFNFLVRADLPSIFQIAELTGLRNVPDLGPLKVRFKLTGSVGSMTVKDLDVVSGSLDRDHFSLSGYIENIDRMRGIDLKVSATGPNAAKMAERFGISIPIAGPYETSFRITRPQKHLYDLTDLKFVFANNDVSGAAKLDLEGARPQLTAVLKSLRMDFRPFMRKQPKKTRVPGARRGMPAEWNMADADIRIQAERFYFPGISLLKLDGHFEILKGQVRIHGIKTVVMGKKKLAHVKVSGKMKDPHVLPGTEVQFEVQGKDFSNLNRHLRLNLPVRGAFRVFGKVSVAAVDVYDFSTFSLRVGENDLSGSIRLDLRKRKQRIKGKMVSKKLDLRPFLNLNGRKARSKNLEKPRRLIPDEPIRMIAFPFVNAQLHLRLGQVLMPKMALDKMNARLHLNNGKLSIEGMKGAIGGGRLTGSIRLGVREKVPFLSTNVKIQKMNLGRMLAILEVDEVLDGDLDLDMQLEGKGRSTTTLLGGLNGRVFLVMGKGRINHKEIQFFGTNLGTMVLPFFNPLGEETECTELNCFVSRFDIVDGLAQSKALVFDTPKVSGVGAGKLNLKTEKLDLTISPRSKEGVRVGGIGRFSFSFSELARPLKLSGTLAEPKVGLDPVHTILTLGKAIGGVLLLGPLGIFAALAHGSLGDDNPCLKAIEAVEKKESHPTSGSRENVIDPSSLHER